MFEIMGGEFKINEQLFSYNHLASKNLYRVNVLIRLPDFEAGSVILLGEKLIHVKKVKGNFVMGRDLLWNKDITLNYKDQETTLIAGKKDIFESTVVKMRPELEILNPISYESERVQNSKHLKAYKMGDKVHIFLYKKGVWIIE
jgi:NMD protein affecting ribosome stability and mRNA decay